MKRIFITFFAALFTLTTVNAQWLDALKKVATEVVDQATDGQLTQLAVIGNWTYSAPTVKLQGDDTLSNLGSTALTSTLESKLVSAFAKVGISEGFCSVTFNADGTFSMPVKSKSLTGTYTYNNTDHSLTMLVGQSGKIDLKGYAYISGESLQLVFPINKFTQLLTTLGSSVSALSSVTSLVKQYENIYLGLSFNRVVAE
ncbi:MAG: DUF4923 family protein [Alistipes sp.]|nr:DUF4923 family protein [Alistipes sp.]